MTAFTSTGWSNRTRGITNRRHVFLQTRNATEKHGETRPNRSAYVGNRMEKDWRSAIARLGSLHVPQTGLESFSLSKGPPPNCRLSFRTAYSSFSTTAHRRLLDEHPNRYLGKEIMMNCIVVFKWIPNRRKLCSVEGC